MQSLATKSYIDKNVIIVFSAN